MNKLIVILLLSTVTCFGDSKFVSGKFVSGAMPYIAPPLPDFIVSGASGTISNLTAGGTYQFNRVIITNANSLTLLGDTLKWTTIICDTLIMDVGSHIYVNLVTNYTTVTIATNAIDGQALSGTLSAHILSPSGYAGGLGGDGGYTAAILPPGGFTGGIGGDGYDSDSASSIFGGTGGVVKNNTGNSGNYYFSGSASCGNDIYGSGGGGGGGGRSAGFLYLRVKNSISIASTNAIIATGENGGNGGNGGNIVVSDTVGNFHGGNGGNGGQAGNGGTVVFRGPTASSAKVLVGSVAGGFGGGFSYGDIATTCYTFVDGSIGSDGSAGNAGTVTIIIP
jgi:hypothetical protein